MNYLFAWRYFSSKKSTNAINIIAWVSIVAIAVGSAALILVLSVFNGFESLVKKLYGDFYADARIAPATGKFITIDSATNYELTNNKSIAAFSYITEEKALLKNGDNQATVVVKGVDNHFNKVSNVHTHIVRGIYNVGDAQKPAMVIGAGIENATGIYVEQPLEAATIYLPNKNASTSGSLNDAFNSYTIIPAGTFIIQQDFDNHYVFTNLAFMQYMLDLQPNQCSYIEVKLSVSALQNVETICKSLEKKLGKNFVVLSRYQQNQSLYTVMQMEKWIIYGILSLILVVAAFNMIGALTMLVLEKHKDIAILRAMGATNNSIKNIFISTGLLLAGIGAVTGMGIAALLCWLQLKFKLITLGSGSFVVDYYPVEMRLSDFVLVLTTVTLIAFIASYLPASKAAKAEITLK